MKMPFLTEGSPWHAAPALASPDQSNVPDIAPLPRIGVITNVRSYRNRREGRNPLDVPDANVIRLAPASREALSQAIALFAQEHVDLIVVDGGDGTVRDVLSAAHEAYRGRLPRFAILRSGKTNALAMDLNVPWRWSLQDILDGHLADRVETRSPVHVRWIKGAHPDRFGFIFGLGAYVRATMLAQKVHKRGWFNSFAVAMTLAWAVMQTFLGGPRSPWKRGDTIRMSRDSADFISENIYLTLGSTLRKMPLGLRPFGPPRDGLKFLAIKAPPKWLLWFLPSLLRGTNSAALEQNGYIRRDVDRVFLSVRKSFILDGERYPGGNLSISRGAPVEFVVP
jgi:hypothetical protein